MVERRVVEIGAIVWAIVAFIVAAGSLAQVSPDALPVVGMASVVLPLSAVLAAVAAAHGRLRVAGALLVLSAATPTYFAWVLNVPAVVVGVLLLATPGMIIKGRGRRSP
jgi:hypothetical protein